MRADKFLRLYGTTRDYEIAVLAGDVEGPTRLQTMHRGIPMPVTNVSPKISAKTELSSNSVEHGHTYRVIEIVGTSEKVSMMPYARP